MVIVLEANAALTPVGKLVGVPIPVAPVVVCVMFVKAVFTQSVGVDEPVLAVLFGVTVIATSSDPEHPVAGLVAVSV